MRFCFGFVVGGMRFCFGFVIGMLSLRGFGLFYDFLGTCVTLDCDRHTDTQFQNRCQYNRPMDVQNYAKQKNISRPRLPPSHPSHFSATQCGSNAHSSFRLNVFVWRQGNDLLILRCFPFLFTKTTKGRKHARTRNRICKGSNVSVFVTGFCDFRGVGTHPPVRRRGSASSTRIFFSMKGVSPLVYIPGTQERLPVPF